jgi:hypothetical protein
MESVMNQKSYPVAEPNIDTECLILEMSGQSWHVPFDALHHIPRVGENIRFGAGNRGVVTKVEYEFAVTPPPVELVRELPANFSYARPVRVVIKA